jgi:hypothetical protein
MPRTATLGRGQFSSDLESAFSFSVVSSFFVQFFLHHIVYLCVCATVLVITLLSMICATNFGQNLWEKIWMFLEENVIN